MLRGDSDKALETGLVDLDVAHRDGQHAAILDQEGLGGIFADGNARGHVDAGAVEDIVGDLDALGILDIEAAPALEID